MVVNSNVFIVGSKGIPAKYGGYETFVENLTKRKKDSRIHYYVACMAKDSKIFSYNDATCFDIFVPNIGPGKAIYYDIKAIKTFLKYIEKNKIAKPIIYVLTCRIGPWFFPLVKKMHRLGGFICLNPDGHEWMRAKWSRPVRMYWKLSEKQMVTKSDLVICDSQNIEKYICKTYYKGCPKTTFIAYGADVNPSTMSDNDKEFVNWINQHGLEPNQYYLSVGRFVPENNFETMIREFMASKTKKSFAIMTNKDDKFFQKLKNKLGFEKDKRIKFVGTTYNENLLAKIRENAFAYIHGHSVGGTNPSLLEALGHTKLNLLYDVGFNKEVGGSGAIYWNKSNGNLAGVINHCETLDLKGIKILGDKAKEIIRTKYSWDSIIDKYETLFLSIVTNVK